MRQYEKYIDTGYKFLPKLPANWELKLGLSCFEENKRKNSDLTERLLLQFCYGSIIHKANQEIKEVDEAVFAKYTIVEPNDIMLNGLNLNYDFVSQRVGIVKEKGTITSAYLALRCRKHYNPFYANYLLKALDAQKVFHGMGSGIRLTLGYSEFSRIQFPVPPKDEQDQIVRYLDWKVSNINRLIHGYQRQIKLLEETKNTILDNAVFHGIENNNLVFSGNKLLEDIPEHWSIVKLRTLLTPISVKNYPNEQLLSVVREKGIIVRDIENKESNHNYIPDDLSGYKLVEKGNFVINKMKAWQGSYGVSNYRGIVSPAYYVFDLKYECPEFFHIAIRSKRYVQFFNQASDGIRVGQWDLSMSRMKEIPFVVPPVEEQMKIVEYIKAKFAEIDSAKPMLEKEIELLREYRTRLISDVVTGQVDVRGVEIPDYTPEEDNAIDDENNDTEEVTESAD